MRVGGLLALGLIIVCYGSPAEAQYRNNQFGFEAGYLFYGISSDGSSALVERSGPLVGVRTGFKLTDRFWITNRAAFSWRDQIQSRGFADQTVYVLHLVPAAVRYYFATNRWRPFVAVTNSFQFFMNGSAGNVFWGPGGSAGMELRLRRDVFLGFQLDAFHMWGDGEFPVVAATLQLDLFL